MKNLQLRTKGPFHPLKVFFPITNKYVLVIPSTNKYVLVTEKCLVPIQWVIVLNGFPVIESPHKNFFLGQPWFLSADAKYDLFSNSYKFNIKFELFRCFPSDPNK